ncbi:MAG: S46 family peptidase [Terriglobales bacterium]
MKRFLLCFIAASLLLIACSAAFADEGMWLFNAFPTDKVKATYGFEPTQAWLDQVRLSSVRFSNGSGSFVSSDGLVFTNHHIGAGCVHELSKSGADYMKNGFYAKSLLDEAKCPDMELNILQSIENVTDKVNAAAQLGMSTADAGKAQRAAMSAIEKDCATATGLRCDVVTLYSGGAYHLYRYKKYTDVRLVFAPEFRMAFFGGDEDNFTYPRYDLDITFFRAYENGKPAQISEYLHWNKDGVKEGDVIFVSGHPGSTGRWLTTSQMNFLRETEYPFRIATLRRRVAALKAFSAQSPENARIAQEEIFGLENSIKAYTGYNVGLLNNQRMDDKALEEQKLRQTVLDNAKLEVEVGDAWSAIDQAMAAQKKIWLELIYVEGKPYSKPAEPGALRGDLALFARELVRLADEKQKPNADRLREYRETALATLEQSLFSTAPIYKSLETAILTESLEEMKDALQMQDKAFVDKVLAGKSPADRAREVIAGTTLDDINVRRKLYEGGAAAVQASTDPLIALMRDIDTQARTYRKVYDDEVDAVEKREGAKIARLKFQQGGLSVPPDATFTLRLSYGSVKSYKDNGKLIPAMTTFGGIFDYAHKTKNRPANVLPTSWISTKRQLDPSVPLNFVSTADIIGGNSGSPVINKNAEVVGIIFDGNIQSLPWRFYFDDVQARAVAVDARGIQQALRKIYNAAPLADELLNGHMTPEVQTNLGK